MGSLFGDVGDNGNLFSSSVFFGVYRKAPSQRTLPTNKRIQSFETSRCYISCLVAWFRDLSFGFRVWGLGLRFRV